MKRSAFWALVGLLWCGFALRVYRLGAGDIWWDEGWGVVLGRLPLLESLARTASDEHPPLYYWALHVWQPLVGESPFAVRFFSVLAGTLTLAVLYRVGQRVGGNGVGLLAVFFLALSRFHLQWSQEIKMYALAALGAVGSAWFLLTWEQRGPNWRSAVGYALCTLGMIYSHYIGLLVALAQGLAGVAWGLAHFGWRQPRWWGLWLGLNVALIVPLIPWALYIVYGVAHPAFVAPPPLPGDLYAQVVATTLTLGMSTYLEVYRPAMLLVLGVSGPWLKNLWGRSPQQLGAYLLLFNLLLPVGLIYTLSLVPAAELYAPKFDSRYLLLLSPFAMLALAWGLRGWARLNRWGALLLGAAVVGMMVPLLPGYYAARWSTGDYAAALRALNNLAHPDDGLVVYTDKDWPVFLYHHHTGIFWNGIPSREPPAPEAIAQRLARTVEGHEAVWVLVSPDALQRDPHQAWLRHLAQTHPLQTDWAFGRYRLQFYTQTPRDLTQLPLPVWPQHVQAVTFTSGPRLRGYDLPVRAVRPGDFLPLALYWESTALLLPTPWQLELVDEQGTVQRSVTGTVQANTQFQPVALSPVSAAWPAGTYTVRLRVGDETVSLTTLQIENALAASAALPAHIPNRLEADFATLIRLEGTSALPAQLRPGETLALELYWHALAETPVNYTVFVQLLGPEFNPATHTPLWGQIDREPLNGYSRTSSWATGQVLTDPYQLTLDPNAPPGVYQVLVGLYDATTGARLPLTNAALDAPGDYVVVGQVEVP